MFVGVLAPDDISIGGVTVIPVLDSAVGVVLVSGAAYVVSRLAEDTSGPRWSRVALGTVALFCIVSIPFVCAAWKRLPYDTWWVPPRRDEEFWQHAGVLAGAIIVFGVIRLSVRLNARRAAGPRARDAGRGV
jgi:uncharacterized membrane protein HdeD (DUF308 family)